jgi:DNA-binding protein YbaB
VATNAALENARKGAAEAMAEVTGGLDLPGLSGLIPGR